jgi:hypothetical protein
MHLDLYRNKISGSIPPEFAGMVNLRSLDLRQNMLVGGIPPELGSLTLLESLHLGKNKKWSFFL